MSRTIEFKYNFEDEGDRTFTFEYDADYSEKMTTSSDNGTVVLYVNKKACLTLAKIFAKLGCGSYGEGYHLHLEEDFDADHKEVLRIMVVE